MKFDVMFKTPDVLHYATLNMTSEQRHEALQAARIFVRNDEYIKIVFDTETATATVIPVP